MKSLFDFGKKSLLDRWIERIEDAAGEASSSFERTGERASRTAERLRRRAGEGWRDARAHARSQRDLFGERIDSIARRADEIKGEMSERREARGRERTRRRALRQPLVVDVRDDDRITLRGRRAIDLRTPDGGVFRYRVYEHPGLPLRLYLRAIGRQVWP